MTQEWHKNGLQSTGIKITSEGHKHLGAVIGSQEYRQEYVDEKRHNELRDLEAELLGIVCKDVEIEPQLQDKTGEQVNSGSNMAQDARLDIHARGFWEHNRSAFFDVRVCHPNAESYRNLKPQQIYRMHENEKQRSYSRRVLDIDHGSLTPLVFTSTGGMGQGCLRYHSRLA
ncbi:hypothetical protein AWC38_SpisGene16376 [Stylophora pistillata]|uniref:Uncharacterized protein n=1 Tax=Stylophora pistillata TaxID=50429 RepID=A0A2B4RPU4_STYPI|nr:hypothetical protein AWC38_SpisGene16376 [Stylophora pistillata]